MARGLASTGPPQSSGRAEHRAESRHACAPDHSCLLVVSHRQHSRWARPRDVSSRGIGLSTSGPFEPGALVLIELFCRRGRAPLTLLAEVMHSSPQRDGSWALGCRFDNMRGDLDTPAREQVQSLLRLQALQEGDGRQEHLHESLAGQLHNPLHPLLAARRQPAQIRTDEAHLRDGDRDRHPDEPAGRTNVLFDLLLLTRGRLQLDRGPVDLAAVVARVLEAVRPYAEFFEFRLSRRLPSARVVLEADPTRLEWVLSALVLNLVRRSVRGTSIWLKVERDEHYITIRLGGADVITPLGPLPSATDLLSRAEGPHGPTGWEDLKLTLARELVEAHGGAVASVDLPEGGGSEFVVRLPRAADGRPPGGTP